MNSQQAVLSMSDTDIFFSLSHSTSARHFSAQVISLPKWWSPLHSMVLLTVIKCHINTLLQIQSNIAKLAEVYNMHLVYKYCYY